MDISRLQIDQSKMLASGAEYFKLFEKHLPTGLDSSKTVLVYEISNLSCIKKIVSLNPEAKHVIVGSKACNRALKMTLPKSIDVKYLEEFDLKEMDMKFDCIMMNPPYQHGLYTDIFAESQRHLKDNGICVCLSPVGRYAVQVKKGKTEFVAKHKAIVKIDDVQLIDESTAKKIFEIALSEDLAIFTYKNCLCKSKCDFTKMISNYDLYCLMKSKNVTPFNSRYEDKPKKFSLRYGVGCGSNSGTKFGFGCTSYANACKQHMTGHLAFMNFDTENERYNCWKSGWTDFMRFCAKVDNDIVPFMGDAINPRTNLKGYASEWTDDDFFSYFAIPQNIKNRILNFMQLYRRICINNEFVLTNKL